MVRDLKNLLPKLKLTTPYPGNVKRHVVRLYLSRAFSTYLFCAVSFHVNLNQLSLDCQAFYFKPGTCWKLFFVNRISET